MDREKTIRAFKTYTAHYNPEDGKIKLKIEHTYRVAGFCEEIAKSLGMSEADVDLAWLCGMLHDIGRFEQIRNFHTFEDAKSIEHAYYAAWVLFGTDMEDCKELTSLKRISCPWRKEGRLEEFLDREISAEDRQVLYKAIWNHSAYRVEPELNERTTLFCNILRDADKIDILKVNYDIPMEVIYDVPEKKLKMETVTKEVMEQFLEEHAVLRSVKKTCVDNIVGHIALVFELVFQKSIEIVKEQGYLEKLLSFSSDNPITIKQFQELKERMEHYMEKRESLAD